MFVSFRKCVCVVLFFFYSMCSFGSASIDINGSGKRKINAELISFKGDALLASTIREVIRSDLAGSSFFQVSLIPRPSDSFSCSSEVIEKGLDILIYGYIVPHGARGSDLFILLCDAYQKTKLMQASFRFSSTQARRVAHIAADKIYKVLLGSDGYFSSQLAYILKRDGLFELCVSDVDGAQKRVLMTASSPLFSLRWSPDGHTLAFVSLEKHKPVVYVMDTTTGVKRILANYRGSNFSPAWSPNGQSLSVVLTKDGYSDIYRVDKSGKNAQTLIHSPSIDTEPAYSSDGRSLFFTSDREGTPQIYRFFFFSNRIERMTFEGKYNVSPAVSPDGRYLAYVQQQPQKGFVIVLRDLNQTQSQILTGGPDNETPSFSPDSQLIAYAANEEDKGILSIVSFDGQVRYSLVFPKSYIISPSWSGKINQ